MFRLAYISHQNGVVVVYFPNEQNKSGIWWITYSVYTHIHDLSFKTRLTPRATAVRCGKGFCFSISLSTRIYVCFPIHQHHPLGIWGGSNNQCCNEGCYQSEIKINCPFKCQIESTCPLAFIVVWVQLLCVHALPKLIIFFLMAKSQSEAKPTCMTRCSTMVSNVLRFASPSQIPWSHRTGFASSLSDCSDT